MRHSFPCGAAPLDFVGTLQARRNPHPTEMLDTPAALDDWFVESGLIETSPGSTDDELAAARGIREAGYELLTARMAGHPLPERELRILNEHATGSPVQLRLTDHALQRSGTVAQALTSLARELAELLGGPDAALLRECGRPECTQIYLDRSRGQRREWCSMKTCGNRVKASTFRARQRAQASV